MNFSVLLPLSLAYSLAFCVAFTILLVTTALIANDAWVHDYPRAIRDRYGPKSERGRRATVVAGVVLLFATIATPLIAMLDLAARTGATPGFLDGAMFGVVMMLAWIVYDLVVLDWLLFCTIRPRFLVLPGTEDMPEYRDKAFHVKVMVPKPVPWPLLMIPGYAVVVGGVTWIASLL
ncbi:hypothetical protein [Stackebrandtia soli]|uniref:hypothetical protein n=1 Tax=Stackebrandtia soli TaxID=1892856 RepID=UPI0039E80017